MSYSLSYIIISSCKTRQTTVNNFACSLQASVGMCCYYAITVILTCMSFTPSGNCGNWSPASFSFSPAFPLSMCFFLQVWRKCWCWVDTPRRGGLSPRNHRSVIKGIAFIMTTAYLETALLDPSCGGCNYWGRGSETEISFPVKIEIIQTM